MLISDESVGRFRKLQKLYIIGNGFDMWHGIQSGYGDFKEYVHERDRPLFQSVENYLPAGDDWSSLESALADVDVDNIIDNAGQFMMSYADEDWSDSGHHDFQYEVQQVVERLSSKLVARFGEWIRTLEIPSPDTAKKKLKHLDSGAAFLTFNYTSTLQDLYAVPGEHVLHIHGEACVNEDELVLGHAWNPEKRTSLNKRVDIEEIDTRLMEANSILDGYFSRTFKPSEELIEQHREFFDQLDTVQTVYVLGHSLSDVDMAYLKALLRIPAVAAAEWHIACRTEDDLEEKRDRLVKIGIVLERAVADLWDDC